MVKWWMEWKSRDQVDELLADPLNSIICYDCPVQIHGTDSYGFKDGKVFCEDCQRCEPITNLI